ncbi:hypothetical protein GQ44DRAFT_603308, partial [Phaeosphaeriaceae sp. PMI808]
KIYEYIVHGLAHHLRNNSLQPPPMDSTLWEWAEKDPTLFATAGTYSLESCRPELCSQVGWEGNPDIAGMLTTYVIHITLVTLYLFAILAIRSDRISSKLRNGSLVSRTLLAVKHSTADFLSASFLFAIAMLSASIISIGRPTLTLGTWLLMATMPLNSVLAVVVLQLIAYDFLRRSRGRLVLWIVVLILLIVLVVRSVGYLNHEFYNTRTRNAMFTERACLGYESFGFIAYSSLATICVLGLGITCYVVGSLISIVRQVPIVFTRLPRSLWWISITLAFCNMWIVLGWFINLSLSIRKLAGGNNNDIQWSFGQVLAIGTWVPVIVEFTYIWWDEPVGLGLSWLVLPVFIKCLD